MIRVLVVSALFLLSACGRDSEEVLTTEPLPAQFAAPDGWTWGLVQPRGQPAVRYGVASPPRVPLATVIILPPRGEPAEAWFETARELIGESANVWLLDRSPESIEADVIALRGLVAAVVRPDGRTPLILMGHGDGAVAALAAVKQGLPADGLILSAPDVEVASGRDPWRRSAVDEWPVQADAGRGWRRSLRSARAGLDEGPMPATPTLVLSPGAAEPPVCSHLPACRSVQFPGAHGALHLERDRWRTSWMAASLRFVDDRVAAMRARQTAPATLP